MRKWRFFIGCMLLLLPVSGCSDGAVPGDNPASASPSLVPSSSPVQSPSPSPSPSPSGSPAAANSPTKGPAASTVPNPGTLSPAEAKKIIEARSSQAIAAIKAKDMAKLKTFAHPDKGIRFSPYCYVNTQKDLTFKPGQLANLLNDNTVYTWGEYDGSGEPIKLTFAQYYDKFLYNHDYANPEKTSYNEVLGHGNMINNIRDSYPQAIVVEYHFSGFDKQYEGMDWASLNLVFEQQGGQWYLVGIVGNRWTT